MGEVAKREKLAAVLTVSIDITLVTFPEIIEAVRSNLTEIFAALMKKVGREEFLKVLFSQRKRREFTEEEVLSIINATAGKVDAVRDLMGVLLPNIPPDGPSRVLETLYSGKTISGSDLVEVMPNAALWSVLNTATQRELGIQISPQASTPTEPNQEEIIEEIVEEGDLKPPGG